MDDLISRRAAIEEIARRDTTDGTVKVYSGREVCDILNALPTAEQRTATMKLEMDKDWVKKAMEEAELTFIAEPRKGEWTPVAERPPEDGQEVIFCDRDVVYEGFYVTSRKTNKKEWRPAYSSFSIGRVTAWMPLPEPYREESDERLYRG